MTDSAAPTTPRTRPVWRAALPWVALAAALLAALGVFVLPWLVPVQVRTINSESQALGFNNDVAYLAMVLGTIVFAAIGLAWRAANPEWAAEREPVVLDGAADASERIDWRVTAVLAAILVAMVALVAHFDGIHPVADAAYSIDRLLRLIDGGHFNREFEYAYGPLLFFPPYVLWLALKPLGVSIYTAYYTCVAAFQVLGLALVAYVLDRLRMPRSLRYAGLVIVFGFSLFQFELGMNYLPVRYLVAFAALLWSLSVTRRRVWWGVPVVALASAVTFAVSPEMGIAAAIGLAVAIATQVVAARRIELLAHAAALVATSGVALWLYTSGAAVSFGTFASGAFWLPVLPGQPAIAYLGTALLLGFGFGALVGAGGLGSELDAAQIGYLLTAFVLMRAALGRADVGHLFWNGLGGTLIAIAIVHAVRPRLAPAFAMATGVISVVFALTTSAVLVPSIYSAGVQSGVISKRQSMRLATRLGRTEETGRQWFNGAQLREPTPDVVQMLIGSHSVCAPYMLQGQIGVTLAENKALNSVYAVPGLALAPVQLDPTLYHMAHSQYVLLPMSEYGSLIDASKSRTDSMSPTFMRRPTSGTDFGFYAMVTGFPLRTHPVNAVYEPYAVLGRAIKRDWIVDRQSGDYVVLSKRFRRP